MHRGVAVSLVLGTSNVLTIITSVFMTCDASHGGQCSHAPADLRCSPQGLHARRFSGEQQSQQPLLTIKSNDEGNGSKNCDVPRYSAVDTQPPMARCRAQHSVGSGTHVGTCIYCKLKVGRSSVGKASPVGVVLVDLGHGTCDFGECARG
jgi:hypothetical protein